jgi:hypothetical protein
MIRYAAWNNEAEVAQIGSQVEREPMRRDPSRHVNPDRSDLSLLACIEAPTVDAFDGGTDP